MAMEAALTRHKVHPEAADATPRGKAGIMMGTVVVELQHATGLPPADLNGSSDPFCSLKVGDQRHLSSVISTSLNPVWNETFKFYDVAEDSLLHINVYDKDTFRKERLGTVDVHITSAATARNRQLSGDFPLKGEGATGSLSMVVRWVPFEAEMRPSRSRGAGPALHVLGSTDANTVGLLKVLLKSGKDLLPMDSNNLSDPYCTLKVGNLRRVSDVRSKSLNPRWAALFDFYPVYAYDVLHINVWDKDVVSKDLMGTVKIQVADIVTSTNSIADGEWPLSLDGRPAGKLSMAISWQVENATPSSPAVNPRAQTLLNSFTPRRASPSAQPAQKAPETKGFSAKVTYDGTPASTSPPSPHPFASTSNGDHLEPLQGNYLHVRVEILRSDVPTSQKRDLFLSMKLGKLRRSTSLKTQAALSSAVAWHETLLFPSLSDISRAYLRVRLYQQSFLKKCLGQVHLPLSEMIQIPESNVLQASGTWPLSGGKETIDLALAVPYWPLLHRSS
mmetsp:Transcript_3656/g.10517  ORF Transcript_3656/g.10517 Transcript_3656/m.10517 type:complete len:504 (-) Transcript_3656:1429-2940(-)